MNLSDKQWRTKLTPDQYKVLRQKGTEAPFSGRYLNHDKEGTYNCVACGAELFNSNAKYESTTPGLIGWPSFGDVIRSGAVKLQPDNSFGMERTEVVCANCGGHLGHLFDDNSAQTGKHYCINSVCLDFKPGQNQKDER